MFDTLIVKPIFNLLFIIYGLVPGADFGVAIIIFTIIIRFLMWPLMKKQLHQSRAMQKLQPEMAKIKAQAKGNKQLEGMMMMELYKKHDVNPFRSIGVLIIQLPILIALFSVIRIFTLHRDQINSFTYGFLKNFEPIKEILSHPESFNEKMLGFLDLTKVAVISNPLNINFVLLVVALGAAVTQFFLTKQTMPNKNQPKKRLRDIINQTAANGQKPNQSEMNAAMMGKMNKFMPIMTFFIMINLPGALTLYYTVSNLVALGQQHFVLKGEAEEMVEIVESIPDKQPAKKATAKARAKLSKEATVVKIKAKDNRPPKATKVSKQEKK